MKIGQSFRMAIKSLMTSKMRALLTMLGIIIGVAAVIIIVSLGNGMQQYMNAQFEQVGVNLIQVMIYPTGGNREAKPDDFYQLAEKYPQYLDSVSPYLNASAAVRHGTDEYEHTSVYGVSETLYNPEKNQTVNGEKVKEGRFLSYVDVEREQKVCVIGDYLNQDMFQGKGLGQTLTIGGSPYTVIGVLDRKADSTEGSGDDVIYLPYGLAGQMGAGNGMQVYLVTSTNQNTSSAAKGVIESMLFRIYQDEGSYMVMTMSEMMEMMDSMLGVLMTILVIIAAISLVVGGIGIMNIMLVSVTERTREIGIRKSLGAKGKDIRSQFIIEAGTTSAIGGVIGIALGILLANLFTVLAGALVSGAEGFAAIPTAGGIAVSFGVSVGIGILFGYLPANKAAKLNPIDALRYD